MTRAGAVGIAALLSMAAACSTSSSSEPPGQPIPEESTEAGSTTDAGGFGSCNLENPANLARYDSTRGCFEAPAPVSGVCLGENTDTGAGFGGLACAIAADGTLYAESVCETCSLSGSGYRYVQYGVLEGPYNPTPVGETSTADDVARCTALYCATLCDTGKPLDTQACGYGPGEAGAVDVADAGDAD